MNKFSVICIVFGLLSGCTSLDSSPFTSQSKDGMVLIGITGANRLGVDPTINISTYDPETFEKNSSALGTKGKGKFQVIHGHLYYLERVTPGHYAFSSVNVSSGHNKILQRQFCDTKGFEVTAGVVTYVGEHDYKISSSKKTITAQQTWNTEAAKEFIIASSSVNSVLVTAEISDIRIPAGNSFRTLDDGHCNIFSLR